MGTRSGVRNRWNRHLINWGGQGHTHGSYVGTPTKMLNEWDPRSKPRWNPDLDSTCYAYVYGMVGQDHRSQHNAAMLDMCSHVSLTSVLSNLFLLAL